MGEISKDDREAAWRGKPGDKGYTGTTGAEGTKGDKGDTGVQGREGREGREGRVGPEGKIGPKGPKRVEAIHPYRWTALAIWIAAVSVLLFIYARHGRHLDSQNTARIAEVNKLVRQQQQSRIFSCKTTYKGVRQTFQPFFPKKDDPTTPQNELTNTKKFNDNIDRLIRGCIKQTKIKRNP